MMLVDQLTVATPTMDWATKAALLGILMIKVVGIVATVLQPQEGLGLLFLSTLFVCMRQVVIWLGRPSPSPSCMRCLTP